MGVVNVTPDSFSDGGQFATPSAAVAHALRLVSEGADIIDVGGESSRPGAMPVSQAEELRRVVPVIAELVAKIAIPVSIDTVKPAVARAALEAGASIINDIGGRADDGEMWELAARTGAGYVVMHMQGSPQTMQQNPSYGDVVAEVNNFFSQRLNRLAAAGVNPEQVVLDVGLGFGKNAAHNLELLRDLRRFGEWKRPLLVGASRKSFVTQISHASSAGGADRLPGSLACACWAAVNGAQIIRAHDVAETRQALRMTEAIKGM